MALGAALMYGRDRRVLLADPRAVFGRGAAIEREWQVLNSASAPDLGRAVEQFANLESQVAPWRCVMVEGNPVTRKRLEAAGAEIATYEGSEISLKGGGGPTCLTRPLSRAR